jgi:hypothetical protein
MIKNTPAVDWAKGNSMFLELSLIIEGATEKASQYIMLQRLIYTKNLWIVKQIFNF